MYSHVTITNEYLVIALNSKSEFPQADALVVELKPNGRTHSIANFIEADVCFI